MSVASRPRRALGAVVATVLACATLALVPLTLTPAASAGVDGPGFEQPAVGECRSLGLDELRRLSNNEAPIDCTQPHTSRVIATGRLPKGVTWDAWQRLTRVATGICEPAWKEALGGSYGSRAMSAYSWGWFIPNASQRSRGARWIRCDLVLWGGKKTLVRLRPEAETALGTLPHPDGIAACLTLRPFVLTTCARGHAFRATGTFVIRQEAYPTPRQFRRAALRRCPARVTTDNNFRWVKRGPSRWRLGDHVVTCYSHTRG